MARASPYGLAEGEPAPEFTLPDDAGKDVSLLDYRGQPVVLYFYPRDDTPGCTKEACGFRDNFPAFGAADAVVFGVSPDDSASHARFKKKFSLPFQLLADADAELAKAFGVWGTKKLYGREFEGIRRTTFIIDGDGKVAKVFRNVRPDGHWEQVLEALNAS